MYKVFINEKRISLQTTPIDGVKSLLLENSTTIEIAIDLMENTSTPEVCIYHPNIDYAWQEFTQFFKNIEAAGGIVANENKERLFIKRLGRWDLPKGKIEPNEQTKDAAIREVEEETGVNGISIRNFIGKTYHIYKEKNTKILKTTHWYAMNLCGNAQATPQTEEGITEVSWKNNHEIETTVLQNTFKNIIHILDLYKL